MNFTILRFDELESTNTTAADHARRGADEGLCIIARQQTAGRGRYGRTWVSGKDAGLYISVILRPRLDLRYLGLITLMAGVAVHDTLSEVGVTPDIKWVNDVLAGDKKISGILAETVETPNGLAVIVGIGINLTSIDLPPEIAVAATSVEAELGRAVTPDEIAGTLTRHLSCFYAMLAEPDGPGKIISEWQRRSTYFSGKYVSVTLPGETLDGFTDGLEENGALRVKCADGSVRIVQTGDVQRLRQNDE